MAIVKMKKVSLVLFDKYREESLEKLREIGVVHLEQLEGRGEHYERLHSTAEQLKNAGVLLSPDKEILQSEYRGVEDAVEKAKEVLSVIEQKKNLTDKVNGCLKEIERLEPIGDFEPETAGTLAEKNLGLTLFSVNKTDAVLFSGKGAFNVGGTKSKIFFAVIGEVPEELKDFDKFDLPEKSISTLRKEMSEAEEGIAESEEKIRNMSAYRTAIQKAVEDVESDIDFETVRSGINITEELSYLRGYCPEPATGKLQKEASANGWGLVTEDPSEDDEVPTQLKLGKFASLLEPVTNFLGILPGYREYDISFFFLCFFSIFTAMLIGDAGYGSLFLIITIAGMIAYRAKKGNVPWIFFLPLLLSVTTIIYGAISGTWFASKSIMEISFFDSLKLDAFRVDSDAQISLVMGISFFLGIIQLLIGVVQNFKKNFPKLSSFAQIGWFAVLVAIYYLVLTLVVKREGLETYPQEMLYVLLGGVVIIFLFGAQEEGRSFIRGIISSLTNFLQLFLDVVGTFSDIMSYVRLFAVGLASVKIAETFNQLGAQMSDGPIIIFGIVIVILGHTINIVLGLMAILVHAVRLNILEYSGKVGVEWSGFKYEPFKINKEN